MTIVITLLLIFELQSFRLNVGKTEVSNSVE